MAEIGNLQNRNKKKSKYFIAKQNTKKIRLNSKQTPKTKNKRKNRDGRRK